MQTSNAANGGQSDQQQPKYLLVPVTLLSFAVQYKPVPAKKKAAYLLCQPKQDQAIIATLPVKMEPWGADEEGAVEALDGMDSINGEIVRSEKATTPIKERSAVLQVNHTISFTSSVSPIPQRRPSRSLILRSQMSLKDSAQWALEIRHGISMADTILKMCEVDIRDNLVVEDDDAEVWKHLEAALEVVQELDAAVAGLWSR